MKKCTSCTKDLPDAALHCVFCGAKQAAAAPAPAPAGAMPNNAKTVMGYQAGDLIEQLRAQGQLPQSNAPKPPTGHPMAAPPPVAPPPAFTPPPAPPPSSGLAPASHAQAATMFVNNPPPGLGGGSGNNPVSPMAATLAAPPSSPGAYGSGAMTPAPVSPMAATLAAPPAGGGFPSMTPPPQQSNPYGGPTPAPSFGGAPSMGGGYAMPGMNAGMTPQGQPGRPIEPWKDGTRLMMFIFGGLLLVSFLLPWSTSPMVFSWDAIIHGEGKMKILPLLVGAGALVAIVIAALPMSAVGRGVTALVIGLAGILTPAFINGLPGWEHLVSLAGSLLVVTGLLLRSEYWDSVLARILATVGAVAILALYVIPRHGEIPIVSVFKMFGGGNGLGIELLVYAIMALGEVALLVCCFLVWLPAPGGSFPKVVMWLLIAWPGAEALLGLVLSRLGHIADSPAIALTWASGLGGERGEFGAGGLPVAFMVLFVYGAASVFGKSLE